jgi:hypothetical protein
MKKPVIQIPISLGIALIPLLGLAPGCSKPPDERVVEMAKQSLETQARQNDRLVEQNKQVIEASKELVAADAKARGEMADLQHDLQTDQHELGRQRDGLEEERRKIAQDRYREPLISSAIMAIGLLAVGGLPLLVCIYLLRAVHNNEASDAALTEVLIEEFLAEKPRLLLPPLSDSREGAPRLQNTVSAAETNADDLDAPPINSRTVFDDPQDHDHPHFYPGDKACPTS